MLGRAAHFAVLLQLLLNCAHQPNVSQQAEPTVRMVDAAGGSIDLGMPILRSLRAHPIIEGLDPREVVVLRAQESQAESWARLRADERGTVDLALAAPMEGTWREADADAWAWSMAPVPARPRGPTTTHLVVERAAGRSLALTFQRTDTPPGVHVQTIDTAEVVGDLVLPAGTGPFPAILVLGGSEGGNATSLRRALDLAGEGFACLALAYFGEGKLEPTLLRIPVERVARAVAWLRQQPSVDGARLGIMGDSRGGELALIAASQLPELRAVVAVVPSGVRWGAARNPNEPAWTWANQPLPFVPWSGVMPQTSRDSSGRLTMSTIPVFDSSLTQSTAEQLAAATIPVERIEGPVLLLAAHDDQLWPSCRLSQPAFERLQRSGHQERFGDAFHCLPDAGHRIGVPGGSTIEHPQEVTNELVMLKGGTAEGAARAEHLTRALSLAHFARALRTKHAPHGR